MLTVFRRYTRTVHLADDRAMATLCGQSCIDGGWLVLSDAPATCARYRREAAKEEGTNG